MSDIDITQEWQCPQCGSANVAGRRFCTSCGWSIGQKVLVFRRQRRNGFSLFLWSFLPDISLVTGLVLAGVSVEAAVFIAFGVYGTAVYVRARW